MATNSTYTVPYRRKREGKTDYKKRMKILLGSKPRVVVRKSSKHITLQLVEFQPTGDKILKSAVSKELGKFGWKGSTCSASAAYLTGLLFSKKIGKKVECVLDIGHATSVKEAVVYAAAKGSIDGGLLLQCAKEVLPREERITGALVASYAKTLKANKDKYQKQFSMYLKKGLDPETLPQHFNQIKSKIGGQ